MKLKIFLFFVQLSVLYFAWDFLETNSVNFSLLQAETSRYLGEIAAFAGNLFGFSARTTFQTAPYPLADLYLDDRICVRIGNPCNCLEPAAVFAGLVASFPGRQVLKLWFIPVGLLLIQFLNIGRIFALAVNFYYHPASVEFNHTYLFNLFIYGFIFALWMIWVNYFAFKKSTNPEKQAVFEDDFHKNA